VHDDDDVEFEELPFPQQNIRREERVSAAADPADDADADEDAVAFDDVSDAVGDESELPPESFPANQHCRIVHSTERASKRFIS
jgi:hypothetical protein